MTPSRNQPSPQQAPPPPPPPSPAQPRLNPPASQTPTGGVGNSGLQPAPSRAAAPAPPRGGGESGAKRFFGPLGIAIVAVVGGIALCVCCTIVCYCCDGRRRKRTTAPPPPIFVGDTGKGSMRRSGGYVLTPNRSTSPGMIGRRGQKNTKRGTPQPLLDSSVRDSAAPAAYHKLPSPPFLPDGEQRSMALSPKQTMRVASQADAFPAVGAPSPEMLGVALSMDKKSSKSGVVSDVVKRSTDSGLGAPADSIKTSQERSLVGRSRSPGPVDESSLFANPTMATNEGLFYAPSHSMGVAPESDSAELAAQAEEHLSVHKAEDVAVVNDEQEPATPATLVRTLSETGSTRGIEALDLLERQLDWLATQNDGVLFEKYRCAHEFQAHCEFHATVVYLERLRAA